MAGDPRDKNGKDDLVITPGGPVPRDSVHHVPPGSSVVRDPSGSYSVVGPRSDSREGKEASMSNNLVLTPGGYKPADLVHHAEPGTVIDASGAPVHCVSRSADKLDVFVTSSGGSIMTAAWEPDFADGWHGWWQINGGAAAPGAPVNAVSRSADHLDVFVVGTDSRVYTAAWEPDFADGWHGWWRLG
jgi:hypothetical protein